MCDAAPKTRLARFLDGFKVALEIFVALLTIAAICAAGWKFRRFRNLAESVVITLSPNFAPAGDHKVLYLNVDIQNVGNVKIEGRSFCVTVEAMSGATRKLVTDRPLCVQLAPVDRAQVDRAQVDRAHLFTIDKGESSTFTAAAGLPSDLGGKPITAVLIHVRYQSRQITDEGQPLTWIHDAIVPLDESNAATRAASRAGRPAPD
ncbi:MAG: hypothetical protein AABO58_04460 [Acidobacteriota bacterium]